MSEKYIIGADGSEMNDSSTILESTPPAAAAAFAEIDYENIGATHRGSTRSHGGGEKTEEKAPLLRQRRGGPAVSHPDDSATAGENYHQGREESLHTPNHRSASLMENEQFMLDTQLRVARKYETYHSIVFNFFVFVMVVQFAMVAGALFYEGFDRKLDGKRLFLLCIVTPIYLITASMVFVTRKHYMLNNAATHAFAGVGGYMLAFVSFIFFNEFNHSLNAAV
jgi:hypothetical protein